MIKDNTNREAIIMLLKLKGKMNISEIEKELNISRPVVYFHLKILKELGLIEQSQEKSKKGAPVFISLKNDKIKQHEKDKIIKFLTILKDKGEIDLHDLRSNSFIDLEPVRSAQLKGYVGKKLYLTNEGKRFLEENSK